VSPKAGFSQHLKMSDPNYWSANVMIRGNIVVSSNYLLENTVALSYGGTRQYMG